MKFCKFVFIVILTLLIGIFCFFVFKNGKSKSVSYTTEPVKYGDLILSVSATGTIEPEELIDVGAQVAGRIVSFGMDKRDQPIDYGSEVDERTVLAKIDDSLYYADMLQARAKVLQAKASLKKSEADFGELKAIYELATNNFARAERLRSGNVNSQADYDKFKSEYHTAKANVDVGVAVIDQAKAEIVLAESALKRAQQNLDYCTIKSPVEGVVIDRRVNIGQTVVASLNAPSLFLIAKDLKRMEVWATVNEADIGKIKLGQNVTFTVDAFPEDTFSGKVTKIRFNASITQNVVSYIVVISADNAKSKLLPYLTANVRFEIERKNNVFIVSNAALRWMPEDEKVLKVHHKIISQISNDEQVHNTLSGKKIGILWILKNSEAIPMQVNIGISNDTVTEIENKDLSNGMKVITGVQLQSQEYHSIKNPFLPQFMKK